MSKRKKIVLGISIAIALILVGVVIWFVFSRYRMDILKAQYEKYGEKYVENVVDDRTAINEKFGDDVYVYDYKEYEEYIVACGEKYAEDYEGDTYPWLAMVTFDGEVIWETTTDNGVQYEVFDNVVVEKDVIYALSRRKFGVDYKLAITKVDMKGQVQDYRITNFDCETLGHAEKIDGSYFISVGSFENEEKVVKLEEDDSFTDVLVCEGEGRYVIEDMLECDGRLYISCYEVPEGDYVGYQAEFSEINGELADNRNYKGPIGEVYFDNEQMEILRNNYTAHLFVWDWEKSEFVNVHTEKQAVADRLNENENGQLVWKVQKFEKGLYSIAASSFSIEAINSIYEFVFDSDEKLISKDKMEKCVYFRR